MTVAEGHEHDRSGRTGTAIREAGTAIASYTAAAPAQSRRSMLERAGEAEAPLFPTPRLSAGLQLYGEYKGSGFTEPKYLVRRGDGQVVQLSLLLHLVTESIDGERSTWDISQRVSVLYGRDVSVENVRYLIERKLEPLGITVPFGQLHDEVDGPRSDLLLTLKGHRVLFPDRRVARIARALAWLHRPAVVALVLIAAAAMDLWLFCFYGAMTPVLRMLEQPVLMLAVFAFTVASLVFHEFGHASACRYGGARPGCIGCGLFLIWPSLYTDVTDVYRIGRAGRLRTDLGGVYFNVVFMVGLAGTYLLTGQSFFVGVIYLAHFEILEQLMPAVRLDGYYILADLAGVPDLYGKIRPILISMLPGRAVPAEVAGLKRSARVIVTAWVLTMVPLLAAELGYVLWNLPRLVVTGLRSLAEQLTGTYSALAEGQIIPGLIGVIGTFMLLCPLVGMAYLSLRLAGRLGRAAVRATRGNAGLRFAVGTLALTGAIALGSAWINGLTPQPLPRQPPIVPILQPGVPTTPPSPPDDVVPRPGADSSDFLEPAAPPPGHRRATPSPRLRPTPGRTAPTRKRPPAPRPSHSRPSGGHPAPSAAPSSTASRPPTPSPTHTTPPPSPTATASPTPTATPTASPTPSPTATPTATATATATGSPTTTATATTSPTPTWSCTHMCPMSSTHQRRRQ